MKRRIHLAITLLLGSFLLMACATITPAVSAKPHFDGTYRLVFGGTGKALYYRFLSDGTLYASRTEAPPGDVIAAMRNGEDGKDGEFKVNVGTWRVDGDALMIGVTETTTSYNTRFDIQTDGDIALAGMPSTFEFVPDVPASQGRDISTR